MIFANSHLGQTHIKRWESPAKLWMSLFCRVQENEGQKNRFQSRNTFMFQTSEKKNAVHIFRKAMIIFYPITVQCHRNNPFPPCPDFSFKSSPVHSLRLPDHIFFCLCIRFFFRYLTRVRSSSCPLRYFNLYRAVTQREGERKEK